LIDILPGGFNPTKRPAFYLHATGEAPTDGETPTYIESVKSHDEGTIAIANQAPKLGHFFMMCVEFLHDAGKNFGDA
jgi:hypothetical protein